MWQVSIYVTDVTIKLLSNASLDDHDDRTCSMLRRLIEGAGGVCAVSKGVSRVYSEDFDDLEDSVDALRVMMATCDCHVVNPATNVRIASRYCRVHFPPGYSDGGGK